MSSRPKIALLNLISPKKNIVTVTIKISIVVPRSGWIYIKNKFNKTPSNAVDLLISELSILAKNKTKIILLNSDGWIKIGKPRGSKSYHLWTPNIGSVKSKPIRIEIDRANKGLIKLYKFSIDMYVVRKNTTKATNEKTICLVRML